MASDMMARINRELAAYERTNRAYGGGSSDSEVEAFKDMWEIGSEEKERDKNAVISGINLLPQLSALIRDEDSLVNYENMSTELTKKAGRHGETAPYAPFIKGLSKNLREDYDMYTKTMESGAKFIDNPNFITDMQGWDDLENTVAKMTLDDGKTPKYQGNGTSLFLTEQNNAINSLISRIQSSSKGTQFRYN